MRVLNVSTLLVSLLIGSAASADCGKFTFVEVSTTVEYHVWVKTWTRTGWFVPPRPPIAYPPPPPWQPPADPPYCPPPPRVPPPICAYPGDLSNQIGNGAGDLGLFEEPKQLGLIAWNGQQELLAIRTDEMTVTKGGYMSVLPLPGKPISVQKGDNRMWNAAENVFKDAFKTAGVASTGAGDLGVVLEAKIGAHEIFVWKIESFDDFFAKIQYYLNVRYKGKVVPLIPTDLKRIMEDYAKNGYEYFAFDMVPETGKTVTKQTILYHFETPKGQLFYPLVISQSGGKGNTAIDLLIVSSNETLTYADSSAQAVVTNLFKNRFDKYAKAKLTHEQVDEIDPAVTKMFGANDQLYARWYVTKGDTDIRSFKDDFRLKIK